MVNKIWYYIILISSIFALLSGNMDTLCKSLLESCSQTVTLTLTMAGVLSFWMGIMKIIQQSGGVRFFKKLLHPLLKRLFKNLDPNGPAYECILMNITANVLGLGNAATPFGIQAMKELHKENQFQPKASDNMIMFIVINTSSVQLLSASLIALRLSFGSTFPSRFIIAALLASVISTITAIMTAKYYAKRSKNYDRLHI